MNKLFLLLFSFLTTLISFSQDDSLKSVLLLIDIQDFYFPEGDWELDKPIEAGYNASLLLNRFREEDKLIIHIRHDHQPGREINDIVKPVKNEIVITKKEINCFKGTELLNILKENKINTTVICGMQTHLCVEAATRAAHDYDFNCILVEDACATRDLKYNNKLIKAEDVHNSTLSTLKNYAEIMDTQSYLNK